MCKACWEAMGRPWMPFDEDVTQCARYIDMAEDQDTGNLHSIIDDWNLEDKDVELDNQNLDLDLTEEEKTVCVCLMAMPEEKRGAALALSHVHQGDFEDRLFGPSGRITGNNKMCVIEDMKKLADDLYQDARDFKPTEPEVSERLAAQADDIYEQFDLSEPEPDEEPEDPEEDFPASLMLQDDERQQMRNLLTMMRRAVPKVGELST